MSDAAVSPPKLTILVTGGAGFIGRHLVKSLIAAGHQVRVLDVLSEQIHGPAGRFPMELEGAEMIKGDVCDLSCVTSATSEVDAVVHLAAETGVGQSMYEAVRYVGTNVAGTASLMQVLSQRNSPIRVVLASSRAVYGEGLYHCVSCGEVTPSPRSSVALSRQEWDPPCPICGAKVAPVPTHEGACPAPGSVYAASKLAQEHLCQVLGSAYSLPTVILRFFNVYGPGQSLSNPYTGLLSTFFARAKNGKPIEVYEDGLESRDFVYIDDVVHAVMLALVAPPVLQQLVCNVGTGTSLSVSSLARQLCETGGWNVPVQVSGAYRVGDVRHAIADTRSAQRDLGFSSKTNLVDGLRSWLNWAELSEFHDTTDAAWQELRDRGLYRGAHIS